MHTAKTLKLKKRDLFKTNFGGDEHNPHINGNHNQINFQAVGEKQLKEPTLVQHTSNQVKKIMENGANLIITPAKWIMHMQENWYAIIVCLKIDPLWITSLLKVSFEI